MCGQSSLGVRQSSGRPCATRYARPVNRAERAVQPRDFAWAAAALVAVVAMVLSVVSRLGQVLIADGWGERLLSIAFVVVGLLFWGWIAAGAWRRTVWGAPSATRGPSS